MPRTGWTISTALTVQDEMNVNLSISAIRKFGRKYRIFLSILTIKIKDNKLNRGITCEFIARCAMSHKSSLNNKGIGNFLHASVKLFMKLTNELEIKHPARLVALSHTTKQTLTTHRRTK
jgi:hypothetical protein